MSLAEASDFTDRRAGERTPPQDVPAEQSVLGAMLMSKDAIADVVEVLKGTDFYRPAHEFIYDAILDLYGRGEPADAITVADELVKRGEIQRIGGHVYLHDLLASVSVAANSGYYAQIVKQKAILRRLVEASIRIAQMGYSGEGDVSDLVDRAQAEVYAVTDGKTSEDYQPLSALMESTLDEIEAIGSRSGEMAGVPTGFIELDDLTNGLHAGQMVILAARPAVGKALALDTPLPTPTGWTTMGAVQVGDQLLGADGRPTRIVAATEVMTDRPCYRVTFSDGTTVVADAHHQWRATRAGHAPEVVTTEEMADQVILSDGNPNWAVGLTGPLQLSPAELGTDPYDLGARLGADPESQRIPPEYLRSSVEQRRALLQGLADGADGGLLDGGVRVTLPDDRLADDVYELVAGLGLQCRRAVETPTNESAASAHVLTFCPPGSRGVRYVSAVDRIDSVPVRCVEVDNLDHMYLATKAMVPTHNSTLGLDFARAASIKNGLCAAIFSLEMSKSEIVMRLLSAEAQIPLNHIRKGTMTDDDWVRMAAKMGEVSEAPLFIDDSPNLTMMEIRAKARRLKQRHDLKLIIIDYMQLMTSGKKVESRQLEVSEFSRQIKLLAKELEVPIVAMSQLNRGPEQRNDKKPMLSDLRESGSLEQDADMVILLHRDDIYDKESPRLGEADFIVAKHRNGPTKTVTTAFQGHYSRFVDMQH